MKSNIAVSCPVRNRPVHAIECISSFVETRLDQAIDFYFVVDEDDENDYPDEIIRCPIGPRGMAHPTNLAARKLAPRYGNLMWVGCDHRFRTPGWDTVFLEAMSKLGGTGFVYCDDLLQGERLPTEVMISSNIVEALGYMVSPKLRHLYIDDHWLALGKAVGRIAYLPNIVIEHMHYSAGKSALDEEYQIVNSNEMASADYAGLQAYLATQLDKDAATIRRIADGGG